MIGGRARVGSWETAFTSMLSSLNVRPPAVRAGSNRRQRLPDVSVLAIQSTVGSKPINVTEPEP